MCNTAIEPNTAPYAYKNAALQDLVSRKGAVPTGQVNAKQTPLQVAWLKEQTVGNTGILPPELQNRTAGPEYAKLKQGQWIIVGVLVLVTVGMVILWAKR